MKAAKIISLSLIALIGTIAYSNTFNAPFVFDDSINLVENLLIKDLDNFIFPSGGYKGYLPRSVAFFTFALNYHFGGLDVTGFHVVNLIIHITNAILVYFLVVLTFKTPFFEGQGSGGLLSPHLIALFSALLFVSHPVHTQAVTYIVQRLSSLAALFYLLSMVMYVTARVKGQGSRVKGAAFFSMSLISAVLAMFTKEISFTLPIMVIIYEFLFFGSGLRKKFLLFIPAVLILIIIPSAIVGIDRPLSEILSDVSERTKLQTNMPRWDYLVTEMRVVTTYIRLLFLPLDQNLYYDYPLYHSLFEPPVFLSFLFLASLFGLAVYLLFKSKGSRVKGPGSSAPYLRLVGFGILWFFITLSVESSVIPIAHVIFEHRLYLPASGAFIAVITSVFIIMGNLMGRRKIMERVLIPVLAAAIIALTGATYARNVVWQSEVKLLEDAAQKSPESADVYNGLGHACMVKGELDRAIEYFRIAQKLNPNYPPVYNNLGVAYGKKGRFDDALNELKSALTLDPRNPEIYNNIAIVYREKGLFEKEISYLDIALKLNPNFAIAHFNLGAAYESKGWSEMAREHYSKARALNPDKY